MRHHNVIKKFGRETDERLALMRSLARALIIHEQIETTEAKAKALRPLIEKMITRALKDDLASTRLLIARLNGEREALKLIKEIAPKYKDRKGGYTRVTKIPSARHDGANMAVIEFV